MISSTPNNLMPSSPTDQIVVQGWEHDYLDLIHKIMSEGDDRVDRTGTGTRAIFGQRLDIDLKRGFPAPTTKKLAWDPMESELLWFIEGSGDERRLAEILHGTRDASKKTIWTANAEAGYWKEKAKFVGDLGRVYGVQWRHWRSYFQATENSYGDEYNLEQPPVFTYKEVDQLMELVNKLKTNNTDRRMIISAWNVGEIGQMALPPCHMMAQFFVANDKLSCQMYQRSVDTMLGLPFNIASYALLTHMLAATCGLTADRLIMDLGDTHIYKDHFTGAMEQLTRRKLIEAPPKLVLNPNVKSILDYRMGDAKLEGYDPMPAIKMRMSV